MADAIVVLNAGSSSLKFSLFDVAEDGPALVQRGQLEGLATKTHFVAKDAVGATIAEHSWYRALGHDGAMAHLVLHLRQTLAGRELARSGIASCTAACGTAARCASTRASSPTSKRWCRSRRCTSRTI